MVQSICLAMIVRDESAVIERCLASVRSVVPFDTWVVCDTGSTDGTQDRVRDLLAELPGELVERPWRGFGENRSEALALARERNAEYVLVADADEIFHADAPLPELEHDVYRMTLRQGCISYPQPRLVRTRLDPKYVGVTHEYMLLPPSASVATLPITIENRQDGGQRPGSDPYERFRRDAALLERGLLEEPDNVRYVFYLAQSYRDLGELDLAVTNYSRRAAMGGFHEEVWYSLYQLGRICIWQEKPLEDVERAMLRAYSARPDRAEPLVDLAEQCRHAGRHELAELYARQAASLPRPTDLLFVRDDDYTWRARDELAIALYWRGRPRESLELNLELLRRAPAYERARLRQNIGHCERALGFVRRAPAELSAEARGRFRVAVAGAAVIPDVECFREVAETLHGALLELGQDAVHDDNYELVDRTPIVIGANIIAKHGLPEPPAGAILYNLEQPGSPWLTERNPAYLHLLRRYQVWDYRGTEPSPGIRATHVPVGYHPCLERFSPVQPDVDVAFFGALNERRESVLAELERRGFSVLRIFGVYGKQRDKLLARARIVLNIHFYDPPKTFEIVRVLYLLANGCTVVSEDGDPEGEAGFEHATSLVPYESLADRCEELLSDDDERARLADEGPRVARARRQASYLAPALLELAYSRACSKPGDIHEHLPKLRELAAECDHVTEMGVRWATSSVALLAGQPSRLVSYDVNDSPEWRALEPIRGETKMEFHRASVLEVEIEPTELLFIDTYHSYAQLRRELELHSPQVSKCIVLHDTTTFGSVGEDRTSPGLWSAVEEFLARGQFALGEKFENNNGLTVLRRVALDLPAAEDQNAVVSGADP